MFGSVCDAIIIIMGVQNRERETRDKNPKSVSQQDFNKIQKNNNKLN